MPAIRRRLVLLGAAATPVAAIAQAQAGPFVGAAEGRTVWAMGVRVTLKALAADTAGDYALFEDYVPAGIGNPAHIHTREVETWTMLEGELDWTIGDRTMRARPGDFLHTPKGVPHRFVNPTGAPARMLLTYVPAGFEQWFLEVGDAAQPAGPPSREQIARAIEAAGRYGVRFLT